MNKYERHRQIIRLVRARGSDTIKNLAMEFEVSERTISRDIEELSLTNLFIQNPADMAAEYIFYLTQKIIKKFFKHDMFCLV